MESSELLIRVYLKRLVEEGHVNGGTVSPHSG